MPHHTCHSFLLESEPFLISDFVSSSTFNLWANSLNSTSKLYEKFIPSAFLPWYIQHPLVSFFYYFSSIHFSLHWGPSHHFIWKHKGENCQWLPTTYKLISKLLIITSRLYLILALWSHLSRPTSLSFPQSNTFSWLTLFAHTPFSFKKFLKVPLPYSSNNYSHNSSFNLNSNHLLTEGLPEQI